MFNDFPKLLWDLIPRLKAPAQAKPPPSTTVRTPTRSTTPQQVRYDELVREMKSIHRLRVNKWRSRTSGCAWEVHYADGRVSRLIESPYPRGPMSCAVFMHEVGHHAIGLHRYRPRCLEEYHAWRWGLDEMRERGFSVTDRVLTRRDDALRYAVAKAVRRGLKRLPAELVPWAPPGVFESGPDAASNQAKTSSSDPRLV
ncbi:MAG: hypothetical protein CBC35_00455 [Planctomycetes bacterium TMED75]|nr:hypothetical protein [Planctomycetaceae bacterium]OUU96863.1 MAG: hypothetical protein CBC35_00455 [Planctomycetes bacterium TMED75]